MAPSASSSSSSTVGMVWDGTTAATAYSNGDMISSDNGEKIRIAFRNESSVPLILCWVSQKGELFHFYELPPSTMIHGKEDARKIQSTDHVEHSTCGHVFCLAYVPEDELKETRSKRSLKDPSSSIIAGYRPYLDQKDEDPIHIVRVCHEDSTTTCCNPFSVFCGGGGIQINGLQKNHNKDILDKQNDIMNGDWIVTAETAILSSEPYDSTNKKYEHTTISGWAVRLEENWHGGDKQLEQSLAKDLEYASSVLPEHARDYLMEKCPIWINKEIKWGPKECPVIGKGCCYHVCKDWLKHNGMHAEKVLCVEVHDGADYKADSVHWRVGGLMVHELSHAYHHRMVKDGYDNREILDCYNSAMSEGLYDCVRVKGKIGPEAKAYACKNCMEYFAELSTAFLGGVSEHEDEDYNKWYPFNRKQLKKHDPRAFKMLANIWKVPIDCD